MKSCSGSGSRPPCPCPEDWNEPWEAVELPRRTPGRPDSSGPVGCQSMGCMRSSKLEDGRSFHLRKMVQIRAPPPMHPAITASVVIAPFESVLEFVAALGDADAVGDALTET